MITEIFSGENTDDIIEGCAERDECVVYPLQRISIFSTVNMNFKNGILYRLIIMKLNFKELHVFNGLSRATEAVEDVREMFADAIYASGRGVASLELCRKIYNSDGEEEYDEKEVELIKEYSRFGNPRFIDAIDNMIEKARNNDTTSK